jgi:predicted heme/steroid binding protein
VAQLVRPQPEIPLSGDFNGDGKDDIATSLSRSTTGHVFVALSNGTNFQPAAASLWHGGFAVENEVPGAGDFNGDGKSDIVTFTRGTAGNVYVALSNSTQFVGDSILWAQGFCLGTEVPLPSSIP